MAHKKGQGSSRNGRDSAGQRLGVKRFGGSWSMPVPFWYGSTEPRFIRAVTWEWGRILPSLPRSTASSPSSVWTGTVRKSAYTLPRSQGLRLEI